MFIFKTLVAATWLVAVNCQGFQAPATTPVPILKQINRQNDDGSYSFGYEAADGSFKIETKYPNGDVAGKYGYLDESGKLREVSYGASSQRGFEPQGAGIVVPPTTLQESPSNALTDGQEDDGQYREDPKIYEDPKYNSRNREPSTSTGFKQFLRPSEPERNQYQEEPEYQQQPQFSAPQSRYQNSQFRSSPLFSQDTSLFQQNSQQFNQGYKPQSQIYHQQPQFSYQAFTQQPYNQFQNQNYQTQNYQPQTYQGQNYNPFTGHPAQNFDPSTGSYTINFTG